MPLFVALPLLILVLVLVGGRVARALGRMVLAACLALVGGVVIGHGATQELGIALLLFVPALVLLGRRRRRPRRPWAETVAPPAVRPAAVSASRHDPGRIPAEPWRALRREAGWAARRIERAHDDCQRFLATAADAPFTSETTDLVLLVERRVPELIDSCLAQVRHATPDERRVELERTVASIEAVAAAAEQQRRRLFADAGGRTATQRAHLAQRLAGDPLAPGER